MKGDEVMTEALQATDALGAEGATHPRVRLIDIQDAIESQYFTTADRAVGHNQLEPLNLLTLCILVMKNGFVVIGKSAPASPENFDAEKGRTFAYEDAVRQLWPLMGFALRDRLHNGD